MHDEGGRFALGGEDRSWHASAPRVDSVLLGVLVIRVVVLGKAACGGWALSLRKRGHPGVCVSCTEDIHRRAHPDPTGRYEDVWRTAHGLTPPDRTGSWCWLRRYVGTYTIIYDWFWFGLLPCPTLMYHGSEFCHWKSTFPLVLGGDRAHGLCDPLIRRSGRCNLVELILISAIARLL